MPVIWLQKGNRIQGDFKLGNKTNDNAYSVKMVTAFKDKWRDRAKLILKIMLF